MSKGVKSNLNKKEGMNKFVLAFILIVCLVLIALSLKFSFTGFVFYDNSSLAQTAYDCGTLNTTNGYYRMNQSVNSTGTCFTVSASNITLDCQGFNINYSTNGSAYGYGIYSNQFNTTIKNCNITDGNKSSQNQRYGLFFDTADNGTLYNNSVNTNYSQAIFIFNGANYNNLTNNIAISNNTNGAIYIHLNSNYNTLTGNNGTGYNGAGIRFESNSDYNTLTGNNGTSRSYYGIYLYTSSNNNLTNNNGISNTLAGIYLSVSLNNTLTNNTGTSNSNHGISLSGSSNNTLTNNNGTSISNTGILLQSSSDNILINNNGTSITDAGLTLSSASNRNILINNTGTTRIHNGIYLSSSSNNTLINNTGTSISYYGIYLYTSSNNNLLINNVGISTEGVGIYLYSSSNNTLINNTGTSNSSYGILLSTSSNNILTGNNGTSNSESGIFILSSNNNLTSNTGISNSSSGILIQSSSNNILTNNIGISNSSSGILLYTTSNNILTNNIGISNSFRGTQLFANSNNNILINLISLGTYGLSFQSSADNLIKDCINVTGSTKDVWIVSADGSTNNTFLNCSYNLSKESVSGAGNELIRKWYYTAFVNDTSGTPLANTEIVVSNSTNSNITTLTTNSTGYTSTESLVEYVNSGGTRNFHSSYTITANLGGYDASSKLINITVLQNTNDFLTLSLTPVVVPVETPSGGSSKSSSSNTICVTEALKESFWTQTTVVINSNWNLPSENQEIISESEAQALEQELLNELKINPEIKVYEKIIKELNDKLAVGERLKIEEKNMISYIGVANVSDDSVVIHVSCSSLKCLKQIVLKINETASIDLNNDLLTDLKITLLNIDADKKVGIKIAVIYNGLLPAKEIPEYEQEQKSNKLLILALVVVGFLIVVTVFLRFRKFK